jgi:uncharacterized protein YjbI with pentapeptide repeats
LNKNTFATRKATSEKEIYNTGNRVIPGQVVSIQLEYLSQDLSLSASMIEDTGEIGFDEIPLSIPEANEFNYRLDANGFNISVRMLNGDGNQVFELTPQSPEFKGVLNQGDYKILIYNHLEWVSSDSSVIPVFIQPDFNYLEGFGNTVFNDVYLDKDLFQLISVKKCENCDLSFGDSTIFGNQFYSEVSFRGADLSRSDFRRSYFENAVFSSFIDNNIPIFSRGHTVINNASFQYCIMNYANFSDTYELNNSNFFFSDINFSNFRNSRGRYINFESTVLGSSTFNGVRYVESRFVGANATGSYFDSASVIDSDLSSLIMTNSFYRHGTLNASILNYALLDSVTAYGTDFCRTRRIGTDFSNLKVDSTTLCNPLEVPETE